MLSISQTLIGAPSFWAVRPAGVVAVFWPRIVVGAICPPVMPYTALLTKITRDVLAAIGRMDDLGGADGRQIAVALVGEDGQLGPAPA